MTLTIHYQKMKIPNNIPIPANPKPLSNPYVSPTYATRVVASNAPILIPI